MRFLLAWLLIASGCSIAADGLGGLDGAVSRDVRMADARPGDASLPFLDGTTRTDAGGGAGGGLADGGVPTEDGGSPEVDSGPPLPTDAGPPPGTAIWERLGPDYDASDFEQSMNIHFEGGEIHVPGMCRDLEMVTIADPAAADWTDYSVSVVRVRFDEVGCGGDNPSFTIVGRTVSSDPTCAGAEGYGCSIDFDNDRVLVGRRGASCGWASSPVRVPAGSINTGEQYSLIFEIQGHNLRCTLRNGSGGSYTATTSDSSMTHRAGGVAFIFDDVDARFGDPTVTAL